VFSGRVLEPDGDDEQGGAMPGDAEAWMPGPSPDATATPGALRERCFRDLVAAVVHGPGVLPSGVRESLVVGTAPPGELAGFVAKVADGGLAVSDDDVAQLLRAGYDEDAVFECVVAVAVAAAASRLRTVKRLLAAAP
jgi:alkylhydroperoxidase family enzyme